MLFQDRHVVVTGGTGALGSAVVGALLEAGATCHVPYIHAGEAERYPHRGHARLTLIADAELADEAKVARLYAGVPAAELIEASGVIEKNGFTTNDDLVHGYGGGYFAPILGSKSRPAGHPSTLVLQENMCMVVQPNVITRDKTAGVQTGEMVRVTRTGFETLHNMPRGFFRSGQIV